MRPERSRARKPVNTESSMALRKASASPRSCSTFSRLRMSRASKNSTAISASDIAVTSAVNTFGKKFGVPCRLSRRNTSVLPGKSRSCCAT